MCCARDPAMWCTGRRASAGAPSCVRARPSLFDPPPARLSVSPSESVSPSPSGGLSPAHSHRRSLESPPPVPGELRKSWIVGSLEAVVTIRACVLAPVEKAACGYAYTT